MILDKQKQEFLAKCLTLLEVKGVVLDDEFILGNTSKCIIYRDQLLYMCISIDYNNFEVERLRNKNTILMTQNKKIIKFDYKFDNSKNSGYPKRVMNIKAAKKIINYRPNTSLEAGLAKTWEWFKQNKKEFNKRHNYFNK